MRKKEGTLHKNAINYTATEEGGMGRLPGLASSFICAFLICGVSQGRLL